jgi:iduronate 2-sulfatase
MMRQHYYAAVSYVDAQIGRLLNVVNNSKTLSQNTIIIAFGDHGWQLGERGEWAKYSTCDLATRVPLIVKTVTSTSSSFRRFGHEMQGGGGGGGGGGFDGRIRFSDALVEIVDIFPTLVDLVDLVSDLIFRCRISFQVASGGR